jgi:uncharacterized protein (TIGR01777 family)
MKILLTGGSGMLGTALRKQLEANGVEVLQLTSSGSKSTHSFRWNTESGIIDPLPLTSIDAIVHLAGAGIAEKPWTALRKKEIIDSRVLATKFLYEACIKANFFPKTFITASGTGVYPSNGEAVYTEDSPFDSSFPANVCKEWEAAADLFSEHATVYKLRFGVILGQGGFLKEILKPAKFYAGAVLGTGEQIVPWVHVDDVVAVILHSLYAKLNGGVYNVVAPCYSSLREITKAATRKINRPIILPPVPGFMVKVLFGERSILLLGSQKVSAHKLLQNGFHFSHTQLDKALESLLPLK